MKRNPQEVLDAFRFNVRLLEHLCSEFDKGMTEATLLMAVVMRTLLYTSNKSNRGKRSYSIIDQLIENDKKYDFKYLSTAHKRPFSGGGISFWVTGDGINVTDVASETVYAGLISKCLVINSEGELIADAQHKADRYIKQGTYMNCDSWLKQEVFYDFSNKNSLSRIALIKLVANQEGGAHLDPEISSEYLTFSRPNIFKVYTRDNKEVLFERNLVFVSLRQIAWEVLYTFKSNGLLQTEESVESEEGLSVVTEA